MIGRSSHEAQLQSRINILWAVIYLAGWGLGLRLVQLQVLERIEYERAAERNRTHIIYQTAPRGLLLDRKGVVLAANEPVFSLIYIPRKEQTPEELGILADELGRHLDMGREELLERLQQAVREETAMRLAENLPPRAMFRLSELKTLYPGINLVAEARRHYPFGRFASHLLGYMGKMDQHSWARLKAKGYRIDSRIGRVGMERIFEMQLRGRDGGVVMEVDAHGRLKGVLDRMPWQAGNNVFLSLDAEMQKAADEGLRDSISGRGAVVALDPRNGAILALASSPGFDPNDFLSTDSEAPRLSGEGLPEFNRAIAGTYPPGSAFKIIVGAAGLNEGRFSVTDSVFCPGHAEVGGRVFLCWNKKGHRKTAWFKGLTESCDVYFYRMGLKTTAPLIERYEKLFGLGSKTNIALPGEKQGNRFGPEGRGGRWYDGDTANLAIGQGELLVTPIQMAVMASAVASRGILWRPHFTERIEYAGDRPPYRQEPEQLGYVSLTDSTWKDLHEALRLAVSSGTGLSARIPGIEVYGKTGTAQNPGRDHAWFVSFAARPGEVPSVATAVVVEEGLHGSSAAAPIARKVMMAAFGMQDARRKPLPAAPPPAGPRPADRPLADPAAGAPPEERSL